MELLPIIYWTLIGVGIVAVVVIMFSYITFHIRKKMGNIPSTEITGNARNKKIKVTNPYKRPPQKKSHHPKVQTRSKFKEYEKRDKKEEKKRTTSSGSESISKLYKRPTSEERKTRIEVVNAPQDELKYHSMDSKTKRTGWS